MEYVYNLAVLFGAMYALGIALWYGVIALFIWLDN